MRRAARVDLNHADIVKAFRDFGCAVLSLAPMGRGVPDLLVSMNSVNWLVEVKSDAGKLTPDQEKFLTWWQGPVSVVRDLQGVQTVVNLIRGEG